MNNNLSPSKIVFKKFSRNKLALSGIFIFIIILILVFIVPLFTSSDLNDIADSLQGSANQAPSLEHIFGTDALGRDYFNRVITGGQVSLMASFVATLVSVTLGLFLGSIAGYFGGKIDSFIMRTSEIIVSLPFLVLAIIIASIVRDKISATSKIYLIMVVVGCLGWVGLARMIRGQILELKEREFILATKALGIKTKNVLLRHIFPNVLNIVIVNATLSFAAYILLESTLSFLGFGVSEPQTSWGTLVKSASKISIMENYWWLWIPPGIFIILTVLAINLIGDGLSEAIDPKSEEK